MTEQDKKRRDLITIIVIRAHLSQVYHLRRGGIGLCDRIHVAQKVRMGMLDPELVCREWDKTAILSASPGLKHDADTVDSLLAAETSEIRDSARRPTMIGVA